MTTKLEHGYPDDPYDEFLYLAALFCSDAGGPDDYSGLQELTHSQVYLACAWNYLAIAEDLGDRRDNSMQSKEDLIVAQKYLAAARRLIEDVLIRPSLCFPCGSPSIHLPPWRQ